MSTQTTAEVVGTVQLPIKLKKTNQGKSYANVIVKRTSDDKEIPIFFKDSLAIELQKIYQAGNEIKVLVDITTRRQMEKAEKQKKEKIKVVLHAKSYETQVTH